MTLPFRTVRRRLVDVATASIAAVTALIALPGAASAGPTFGGGDCWRGTTPYTCYVQFTASGQPMLYTAVDKFSAQGRPNWHNAFIAALQNWNIALGPQSMSTAGRTGAARVDADATFDSVDPNLRDTYGITYIFDWQGRRIFTSANPVTAEAAVVRMNIGTLPDNSGQLVTSIFAHELGHVTLQGHTDDARDLMYTYIGSTQVTVPRDAADIGAIPPCNGSLGSTNTGNNRAGTRCIYGWNRSD